MSIIDETGRKLKVIQDLTGKSREEIIADAIELYWEVNEVEKYSEQHTTESELFKRMIFDCEGSAALKGRVCNLLRQHGIWTIMDFMEQHLDCIMGLKGIGPNGRKLLEELVKKIVLGSGIRMLATKV